MEDLRLVESSSITNGVTEGHEQRPGFRVPTRAQHSDPKERLVLIDTLKTNLGCKRSTSLANSCGGHIRRKLWHTSLFQLQGFVAAVGHRELYFA
eukprot:1292316-Prymnesium_polylepis.3